MSRFVDWLKTAPLYPLPQHGLSRLVLRATRWRQRSWKDLLIKSFVRRFRVNLSEAVEPDPRRYPDFNSFFTRALVPDARPSPTDERAVACPADGTLSEIGTLQTDRLLQAKGLYYRAPDLLGRDGALAERFADGCFATVYLSPRDYHRVHMPVAGRLRRMIHVPGRLFSVAPHTVRTVPELFTRNERVIALFDTDTGPLAVALVGAMCVGSIETVWASVVTPPRARRVRHWHYGDAGPTFARGDEIGRFNMGSTVILLFGPRQVSWDVGLAAGNSVRMGQALGQLTR